MHHFPFSRQFTPTECITALYRVLLRREPDPAGLKYYLELLGNSWRIEDVVQRIVSSEEHRKHAASRAGDIAAHGNEKDFLCKWLQFTDGASAHLCLPLVTNDPIVADYLRGDTPNSYMLELLRELSMAGNMVVDLGCHVGTFSIGAAAMGRKVVAVDANAFHIKLMQMSKSINGFTDLSLYHAAISSSPGFVRFIENGLFGAVDFAATEVQSVEVRTLGLDEIVTERQGRVRLIKMDIEGAEYDALLTGKQLLQRDSPAILFESNGPTLQNAGHSVDELRSLFESFGYRVFRVENNRWIYSPPGQMQPEAWVDMIALRDDDQSRCEARIAWRWDEGEMLSKCLTWASLPYENTRKHLLSELSRHDCNSSLERKFAELRRKLEGSQST